MRVSQISADYLPHGSLLSLATVTGSVEVACENAVVACKIAGFPNTLNNLAV